MATEALRIGRYNSAPMQRIVRDVPLGRTQPMAGATLIIFICFGVICYIAGEASFLGAPGAAIIAVALVVLLFTMIEVFLFRSGLAYPIARTMMSGSWLLVLGAFVIISWFASRVAFGATSSLAQYAALGGFVVAEALIFVPMLAIAQKVAPGVIQSAALVTLLGFAGLTAIAFISRQDFSFFGGLLKWGFIMGLVAIVGGVIFGWQLGMWFSVIMVALAGAAILYDTSNIIRCFPEDRYVGAALQLFASVALMFWYILRIFISARR
jgi:FtsH-binding integral membrane protein